MLVACQPSSGTEPTPSCPFRTPWVGDRLLQGWRAGNEQAIANASVTHRTVLCPAFGDAPRFTLSAGNPPWTRFCSDFDVVDVVHTADHTLIPRKIAETGIPFSRFRLGLLFVAIASTACLMPVQNDTWWHLREGRVL